MPSVYQQRPPKTFFPNLDGLRTIACLAVFGFHSLLTITPKHASISRGFRIFEVGTLGVSFFYVLSGFLITYMLLEERQQYQRTDLLGFYLRRVLRIWPLFYACIAYGFLVPPLIARLYHLPYYETASLWRHLLFLGNLDSVWQGTQPTAHSLAVLWSIAIEEQFYLLWPLLLMFIFRRWQLGAFLAIIFISGAFRYFHSNQPFLTYRHSLAVMSDMAVGGLAAWASFRYTAFRQQVADWPRWLLAVVYPLGIALLLSKNFLLGQAYLPAVVKLLATDRLTYSLFFVFVILEQNYTTRSWFKIKNNRLLTYWGTYTYGFYCLHAIILEWLVFGVDYLHLPSSPLDMLLYAAVGLLLSGAAAWLSYRYWERPFLVLKNRRKSAAVAATDTPPESVHVMS